MNIYILCIILGIILYFIIQDSINEFSIGIPPKRRPWLERTCATSYVSTVEDVDSNLDDEYDTASESEPSDTI